MTIESGKEYKIYYAGKARRARVEKILKTEWGSTAIVWRYYMGCFFGWSSEYLSLIGDFKSLLGDEIQSAEI